MTPGSTRQRTGLPTLFVVAGGQALRAAVTALIPITLLSLFGWAAAGSGTGQTGDALRGAGWIWMASHHISFSLRFTEGNPAGHFALLPIGLLLIPILTLRGAGLRLARLLKGQSVEILLLAALTLTFSYAMIVVLMTAALATESIAPRPLEGFAFAFILCLVFAAPRLVALPRPRPMVAAMLRFLRISIVLLLGVGLILTIIGLVVHLQQLLDVITILRLGVVGSIFLLIISILYLPNAAIWAASYASGTGFAMGVDTSITPFETQIGSVPAFPLFTAIPATPSPFAPYLLGMTAVIIFYAVARTHHADRWRDVALTSLRLAASMAAAGAFLAWLGGGALVGARLAAVGPSPWQVGAVLAGYTAAASLLWLTFTLWRRRRSGVSDLVAE
jgi:hypothetical protein